MEIKEIGNNIKKSLSGNGMYILIGGGALLLIFYMLSKGDSNSSNLTVATGYSAYPDEVTNANVIIGEVNDHTTNELSLLKEQLNDTTTLLQEGDNSILEKIDTSTESITEKIDTGTEKILQSNSDNTESIIDTVNKNTNNISNQISSVSSKVNTVVNNTTVKNTTTKTTPKVTYFKAITSYKGNSIVDALKKRGVNSSFAYRKKIAQANGIKNYTGTASQNTKLLNLMKKGKLIKP